MYATFRECKQQIVISTSQRENTQMCSTDIGSLLKRFWKKQAENGQRRPRPSGSIYSRGELLMFWSF